MSITEETIDGTLDANGQLVLMHLPQVPPGPVQVTIRIVPAIRPQRGVSEVIQEIAAEQRARGFCGRSAEELRAEDEARVADDAARDEELDAARGRTSGAP